MILGSNNCSKHTGEKNEEKNNGALNTILGRTVDFDALKASVIKVCMKKSYKVYITR